MEQESFWQHLPTDIFLTLVLGLYEEGYACQPLLVVCKGWGNLWKQVPNLKKAEQFIQQYPSFLLYHDPDIPRNYDKDIIFCKQWVPNNLFSLGCSRFCFPSAIVFDGKFYFEYLISRFFGQCGWGFQDAQGNYGKLEISTASMQDVSDMVIFQTLFSGDREQVKDVVMNFKGGKNVKWHDPYWHANEFLPPFCVFHKQDYIIGCSVHAKKNQISWYIDGRKKITFQLKPQMFYFPVVSPIFYPPSVNQMFGKQYELSFLPTRYQPIFPDHRTPRWFTVEIAHNDRLFF